MQPPTPNPTLVDHHLARLRTIFEEGYSLNKLPEWICDHTRLKGEPYSFLDHEFQERILRDPSPDKVVRKCSQIGLSELSVRVSLAAANVMPGFTVLYTLPTAKFATTFVKTRVDPVIEGSSTLRRNLSDSNDSTEVKQFGESFVFFKGTKGASAAISIPVDFLVHDEVDFSDQVVLSNYQSRLTHSKWKWKWKFSTPTVEGYGISASFKDSRKHWNKVKCCHCNHWFVPSYFENVKLPGYDGNLMELKKDDLYRLKVHLAKLLCPKCGKEPDLSPPYREWVVENNEGLADVAGYQIQPFDAPKIITPGSLIIASLAYERYADFVNFNLGLPSADSDTQLSAEELNRLFVGAASGSMGIRVMGIDVGLHCHVMVGDVHPLRGLEIIKKEIVPIAKLQERKNELGQLYRVRLTVMDSMPYFETLLRMQGKDSSLWGARYSNAKGLDVYKVRDQEEDPEEGKEAVKEVAINRNRALDTLMDEMRAQQITFVKCELDETAKRQLSDMKRIKDLGTDGDITTSWQKSAQGDDHFHHTLLYTWIASRMVGMATPLIIVPPFMGKVRIKDG